LKRPKKILFHINYLYHLPAIEPILELFADDNNYDTAIILALDFDLKFGIFRKRKSSQYLKNFIGSKVRIAHQTEIPDVVITTDVIDKALYPNSQICMVYHGPTFNKTVTYRELKKHLDDDYIIFAESQFAVDKFIESHCLGNSKTEIIGFPKLDPIISNKFDRAKILTELGLDANKKTILYAPTYKPTSLNELTHEIIEVTKDFNLIIKLHHYSWMGKYAKRSQSRKVKKAINGFQHVALITRDSYSIVPYFSVADTLISEASGGLTEFLITEKVGIVYNLPQLKLKHSDNQPLLSKGDDFLKDTYINISSPNQLSEAIQSALNPTNTMLRRIKLDKEKYFYKNDGNASQRVKSFIDKLFL